MKRILVLMGVLVLLATCVADIGGGSVNAAKAKQVTLKFYKSDIDVVMHDYWLRAIKEYEKKKPNIKIQYSEAQGGKDMDIKLNAAYASGDSPDIIGNTIKTIAQRADKKQYAPLDKYINRMKDKNDILENVYEMGRYHGKVYGIGYYPIPAVFAYRKDFFAEAGLDPEKPPKTWEELANYAVKLTRREGNMVIRSGLVIPIDDFKTVIPFSIQNGARNVSKKGEPAFDNPQMVETLEYFTDLFRNKKVTKEVTRDQESRLGLFVQGQAAMSVIEPSRISKMLMDDPSLKNKIGFIEMKRQQRSSTWCGCHLLFISSESKHKKEAWDFIQYAIAKEEMWKRYQTTNCPVIRKSLMDQYMKDDPFFNKAIMEGVKFGAGAPKVIWATLYTTKYLPQAVGEAFYGKKTPARALKDNLRLLKEEIRAMQ
jgi:multiple sugar transport system substrate-binding protein